MLMMLAISSGLRIAVVITRQGCQLKAFSVADAALASCSPPVSAACVFQLSALPGKNCHRHFLEARTLGAKVFLDFDSASNKVCQISRCPVTKR